MTEARSYVDEQGLKDFLTSAVQKVITEKPADAKARLIEVLSESVGSSSFYVHNAKGAEAGAKGGKTFEASKAAILFIEYQNEFTTPEGKLHEAVKPVMEATGMLQKSVDVAAAARKAGVKVMHTAISFAEDASDNPNKGLGILGNCAGGKLFTAGTWNAAFCDAMTPQAGDIEVLGKKGLDAFPGTDLEAKLKANGIETLVLAGFLSNCCVESTMRTAYEKGYDVITLTDCTATTSADGQKTSAAADGTYGMFSKPMTAEEFTAMIV